MESSKTESLKVNCADTVDLACVHVEDNVIFKADAGVLGDEEVDGEGEPKAAARFGRFGEEATALLTRDLFWGLLLKRKLSITVGDHGGSSVRIGTVCLNVLMDEGGKIIHG